MRDLKFFFIYLFWTTFLCSLYSQKPNAPLFRDPVYEGPADPIVRWNSVENNWWLVYTARRANQITPGVAYCYGTNIGIASSDDNGKTWVYRGELNLNFERGKNTFWAPEILQVDEIYHLFVTYIRGVYSKWGGRASIHHYTSKNMWDWEHQGKVALVGESVIDATIFQKSNDDFYMWYKDEQGWIRFAESKDLFHWKNVDNKILFGNQEGPIIFEFENYYWMLTDEWKGMRVYKSVDLVNWEKQGLILNEKSLRQDDQPSGAHGDVVVLDNKAYIFYFTHPGRKFHEEEIYDQDGIMPYSHKRSVIQVARLYFKNNTLVSDRTENFNDFFLKNR